MSLDPTQLIGQQIGHYEIRSHIARGGMADVYLAFDVNLHRKVALKVMLAQLSADTQFVERFRREAQTVAQLEHPNIIQVYGIGLTPDQRPYIAMPFIDGGALRDTLEMLTRRGELLPTTQALAIVRQMADALRVAHAAGIVHRDIKPSNILLRPDGTPILVDLGIAAVQSAPKLTQTGTLIGTPNYMSPEQARGEKLDGRSDLYSLGVILYEMLAGKRPFEADDPLAVLHKHVYEEPTPLENIRHDLTPHTRYVVQAAMQKNPMNRLPTAVDMRNAIDQAIEAEGGPGRVSTSGAWRPHPMEQYTIGPSKIVPPNFAPTDLLPPDTGPTVPRSAGGRGKGWVIGLAVALLALLFLGGGYLAMRSLRGPDTAAVPTATPVMIVAEDNPTALPTAAATETAVPNDIVATAVPEPTALPSATPPPPTDAPPTETPLPTETPDMGPERLTIGYSAGNLPIEAVRIGGGPKAIVFIGGLHAGAAPSTVSLAETAVNYFSSNFQEIPPQTTLYIITNANPDSRPVVGELDGRLNANGVDLNRNWDCRWVKDAAFRGNTVPGIGGQFAFSEPETQAMVAFIESVGATAVVFWEAKTTNGLASPGACNGPSRVSVPLAQAYGIAAGYPIGDFENLTNQTLNGDGTNWLDGQGIPAIAIILPDYVTVDWGDNLDGIRAVLRDFGS
ncbi:MAG: protein kinase [Chloroflexi bacterium]|nr:protein kinase [Chloroflexota bacterium]